jgi:xanthine dehydrogenase molybdenum-binding subunit
MTKHEFVPAEGTKRRAWGMACAYKNVGYGSGAYDAAGAEVELFEDGRAIVRAGAAEIGQGLVGVLAQIVSEELGVPYHMVEVLVSDTDLTPDGDATTASRQTYVTGNAAWHACQEVRKLLSQTAAEMLDVVPKSLRFANGQVTVAQSSDCDNAVQFRAEESRTTGANSSNFLALHKDDAKSVSLVEVVKTARREGRLPKISYQYRAPHTEQYHHFAFGFGVQAALVEVDIETGETKVLKVIAANDVGRVMNPLALQGQIEGGISMGLGMALQEKFVMEQGQVKTTSLNKCNLPTIDQTPQVISFFIEEATKDGPYGAKGVGELSSIPTTPAIINGIYHATGIRCYSLPADKKWLRNNLVQRGVNTSVVRW